MGLEIGKTYFIKNVSSGKYLNVYGTDTVANSRNVNVYAKENCKAQKWVVRLSGNGARVLTSINEAYALNIYVESSSNCTMYNVAQNTANDYVVDFLTVDASQNLYKIKMMAHNKYLCVYDLASGNAFWSTNLSDPYTLWQLEDANAPVIPPSDTMLVDGQKLSDLNLNSSNYSSPINPFSPSYNWQCTWYAWGRAKEKTGKEINFGGATSGRGAGKWHSIVTNVNLKTVPSIGDKGIIEWINPSGGNGHVAFLEKYDGTHFWFSQANKTGDGVPSSDDGVVSKRTLAQVQTYCSGLGYTLGKFLIV